MQANMGRLVRLARLPVPLPLGGLTARRSLLSVANLVTAIDSVLGVPVTLRRPLIVADDDPVTLPEMIAALRRGLGRRPGLFSVPAALLEGACRMTGRGDLYDRVAGPLVADASALRSLGWSPSVAALAGLEALMRAEGNGLRTGVSPK